MKMKHYDRIILSEIELFSQGVYGTVDAAEWFSFWHKISKTVPKEYRHLVKVDFSNEIEEDEVYCFMRMYYDRPREKK
jgi:hypothetical protein